MKFKIKGGAPPALLADAPYFFSGKSKQKRYRQVRRPARWAGCPAMLADLLAAAKLDSLRQLRPSSSKSCASRRLSGSLTSISNAKSDSAATCQHHLETIRLCKQSARDFSLMSH